MHLSQTVAHRSPRCMHPTARRIWMREVLGPGAPAHKALFHVRTSKMHPPMSAMYHTKSAHCECIVFVLRGARGGGFRCGKRWWRLGDGAGLAVQQEQGSLHPHRDLQKADATRQLLGKQNGDGAGLASQAGAGQPPPTQGPTQSRRMPPVVLHVKYGCSASNMASYAVKAEVKCKLLGEEEAGGGASQCIPCVSGQKPAMKQAQSRPRSPTTKISNQDKTICCTTTKCLIRKHWKKKKACSRW
eukprot:1160207-Pelagomonas_calceolata.AAC.6